MRQIDMTLLNPGIRQTVAFLRAHGFDTCDSGDGRTHEYECDQSAAYVHMLVKPPEELIAEAQRLYGLLGDRIVFRDPEMDGDTVTLGPMVEAHYSPRDGIATISLWHVDDDLLSDPREFVVNEAGDGSKVLTCGWCSCAVPDHMPWCTDSALKKREVPAGHD